MHIGMPIFFAVGLSIPVFAAWFQQWKSKTS
jgi:hypothetical protein